MLRLEEWYNKGHYNFFFLISKKDVYSKNCFMQKHKAYQRLQRREKEKQKRTNYKERAKEQMVWVI